MGKLQVAAPVFFSGSIEADVLFPSLQARSSPHDVCRNFLIDFAKSDPAQDFSGQKSELFKGLIQACKKQTPKTHIVAGSTVDQAVNSTFAALVYLTPDLFEKLQKYVNSGGKVPLSDEFAQVYSLADGNEAEIPDGEGK